MSTFDSLVYGEGAYGPITVSDSMEIFVDRKEYSRYEEGKKTITATLVVSGGAPYTNKEFVVDLVKARRSRDAVVATSTVSITGLTDPQEVSVEFYLPDIVDQDLIHLARHGSYFVRVTDSDTDETAETDDFWISIVTVERLKNDFLFGVPLKATEIREPKLQPQQITGVVVEEISATHPLGSVQLSYNHHTDPTKNASATIGSGSNGAVAIEPDNDLAGAAGNAWTVVVEIPSGTSGLTVTTSSDQLIVKLAVNSGVPDNSQNTASQVATAISNQANFSASAAGTGADPLDSEEGPTQFLGGESNVVRQLSWDGGPLVNLVKPGTYVLQSGGDACGRGRFGGGSEEYVCIRVRSQLLLPTENVSEIIIIDRKKIDDQTLRNYLDQAISWVENDLLQTPVEPTNVVTDRDPTTIQYSAGVNAPAPMLTDSDFDKIVSPLTYFTPKTSSWVTIQFPWPQLLRVDALFGAIANTRVIDIDLEWVEHAEQTGLVQLVPYNQEIAFDFLGLIWVNAIRGATEIPNFWHYNAIVGLRDTPDEVQELIAKKAAIDALTVVGMALRPGVGSTSLSRDGISESVSYTNSAQYGVYTGTITSYKEYIKEETDRLRAKYRGPLLTVV